MEKVLYLCHRIPFPPNKGDKIATYNILKFLQQHYQVYLGCFIDDKEDLHHRDTVAEYCVDSRFEDITHVGQWKSGLRSLFVNAPVTLTHYRSKTFQQWVSNTIAEQGITRVFCYSSGVAQFVENLVGNTIRVIDMADIDSDKWRQYAENKSFPTKLIYQREYALLSRYESSLLDSMEHIGLVTQDEVNLFCTMHKGRHADKVVKIANGVDVEYFNPQAQFDYTDSPSDEHPMICFTGAMDYWANADAVVWFCEFVWPLVRKQRPELYFYIVGGNPTDAVQKLSELPNVVVTGRVVDVRPYVAAAQCVVAPLRIARGVQNKVLEAMAMDKTVIMTSMAQEGIDLPPEQQQMVQDDPERFAQQLVDSLTNGISQGVNRGWIDANYSWSGALSVIPTLFGDSV